MIFRITPLARTAALIACGTLATVHIALAEDSPDLFVKAPPSKDSPPAKGPVGVVERQRPSFDAIGYRYAGITFYPKAIASLSYDDNLFSSRVKSQGTMVWHMTPSLQAAADYGRTKVGGFIKIDSQIYSRFSNLNAVAPYAGLGFKTEVTRDLVFQGRADYAYTAEDSYLTRSIGGVANPSSLARHHDAKASASVNQTFGRVNVSLGGAVQRLAYTDVRDGVGLPVSQNFRNETLATITARGGYEVSPGLRTFVESSVNRRDYENVPMVSSKGFRVVGGVSSELSRLIAGEVYAGYMAQTFQSNRFGTVDGYTAGGRLIWYPTNFLTLTLNADRAIQESFVKNTANPIASIVFNNTLGFRADYEVLRNFIVSGRVSVADSKYVNDIRRDQVYTAGATASYMFNRMLSGSLDYRHTKGVSGDFNSNFNRNVVTASLKAQY